MTAAIAPIVPITEAASLASSATHGATATAAAPPSPELAQKFQDLMHRTREDTGSPLVEGHGGDNAMSRILQSQQNEFRDMHDSMLDFVERSPTMTPMENMSASVAMMQKTTNLHIKTSMATGVTKATNKSLESLLKNQ
jgi:hypothetical protein